MPAKKLPANCYWRGDVIWGRLKVAGVEHRASLRTANVAEAKVRLGAWRTQIERDLFGAGDAPTFKEAVLKWAREVLPNKLKVGVRRRYLNSVGMTEPTLGALRVTQIDERQIARHISSRAGRVTNATIRRDLTALSSVLSACVAWGWIHKNPAKTFDRSIIEEQKRTMILPTDADIEYALAIAPAPMVPLLRFLAETGMREMEAVTLEARNVDWTGRKITLVRTKSSRPRALVWRTRGGDAGKVLDALAPLPAGLVFPNRDGTEYRNVSSNFGKVMRDAVRRAEDEGVEFRRWRIHDLRHRFAVRWLQAGGDIYRLSRHLGHTSVKTTEIYLYHLTEDELDAVRGVSQTGAHARLHEPAE